MSHGVQPNLNDSRNQGGYLIEIYLSGRTFNNMEFDKQQLGYASLAHKTCVVLRSYGSHANITIRYYGKTD